MSKIQDRIMGRFFFENHNTILDTLPWLYALPLLQGRNMMYKLSTHRDHRVWEYIKSWTCVWFASWDVNVNQAKWKQCSQKRCATLLLHTSGDKIIYTAASSTDYPNPGNNPRIPPLHVITNPAAPDRQLNPLIR